MEILLGDRGGLRVKKDVVKMRVGIPYWEPGGPGSNPPGLTESLETLGRCPDLLEPVVPGGTMGFIHVCGSGSLLSDSRDIGASAQDRMVGASRTCHCPLYSFSYPHSP